MILGGQLVVAVDHVGVAFRRLDQVLDLFGRDASPAEVSEDQNGRKSVLPMPIRPARMFINGDLDSIAELALCDLDLRVLAFFVGTTSAIVRRRLCRLISLVHLAISKEASGKSPKDVRVLTNTSNDHVCDFVCG